MNATAGDPVVILLAGGKGTRVRDRHPTLPKPMIPCGGRPFIEWVIRHFAKLPSPSGRGVRGEGDFFVTGEVPRPLTQRENGTTQNGPSRFVVSLGHLAEAAEAYFRNRPADGISIATIREPSPLGTGGGLRWAWESVPDADVVVANADSLVLADLRPARVLFEASGVDGVVVGVEQDDASRYGTLQVDAAGRLRAFQEKRPGAGLVNAGIYFLRERLRKTIEPGISLSMETEVIPAWLAMGCDIRVAPVRAPFLDIGTHESLDRVEGFLTENGLIPAQGLDSGITSI